MSKALEEMTQSYDSHAVLSLQNAAEAFFLAHAFAIPPKEPEQAVAPAAAPQPSNAVAETTEPAEQPVAESDAPPAENVTEGGDTASEAGLEPIPQGTSDARDAEALLPDEPASFPMSPTGGAATAAIPSRLSLNKHTQNLLEFAGRI